MKLELKEIINGYVLYTDPGYWSKWDNDKEKYFSTHKQALEAAIDYISKIQQEQEETK